MNILGISCFYHDSAAALLQDGMLIAAAEEERFSRLKHDSGYPAHAIRFCLEASNIEFRDLDYVVFYEKPFVKFERILTTSLHTAPRSLNLFARAMKNWLVDRLWIKNLLQRELGVDSGADLVFGAPFIPRRQRFSLLTIRRGGGVDR